MGTFALVRPYREHVRKRVMALLEEAGFEMPALMILPTGTANDACAEALSHAHVDLWVVPFHSHRQADTDQIIDGIGVLEAIDDELSQRAPPVLMPVSDFSFASLLGRRIEELRRVRPALAARVAPLQDSALESEEAKALVASLHPKRRRDQTS